MDAKLAKFYYSPQGYWRGITAIKKLADTANVSEETAKLWLIKQALWQIFLPVAHFHLIVEEVVHQDLAVLQDRHTRVDQLVQKQPQFVHAHACQVVAEYLMPRI